MPITVIMCLMLVSLFSYPSTARTVKTRLLQQNTATSTAAETFFTFPVKALYTATLSGESLVPHPIPDIHSSGIATVILVNDTYAMATVEMTHIDNVYMAHIHSGNTSVNGPPLVWAINATCCGGLWQPFSVSNKSTFSTVYTFNPSMTGLQNLLPEGLAYFNVHTVKYQPHGEIRGQFQPLKTGKGSDSVLSYCTPIMAATNATTGQMACATCGTGPGGAGENMCVVSIDGKPVPLDNAAEVAQQFMNAISAGFL